MTGEARLHSRKAVQQLFDLAEGKGGKVVLLTAGDGPYYAGLQRGAADHLLEAALTLLDPDRYETILLITGEGEHLPDLEVTNRDICSRQRLIWLFKDKDQPVSMAAASSDNDLMGDLSSFNGEFRKYRVVDHSHRKKWQDQILGLLNQVEEHMAPSGPRCLIVIDDQFLMPRTGSNVDHPLGSNVQNIQRRFGKLPESCGDSRADIVMLCRNLPVAKSIAEPGAAGPIAFQIMADAGETPEMVERARMEARYFPKLVWPTAPIVELESMKPTEWNEGWLPGADPARPFYEILRKNPPVVRDDPLSALNKFIGLEKVRQELIKLRSRVSVQREKRRRGYPVEPISLHVLLLGQPGTGKTEVAKAIAHIYRQLGILTGPFVHCSASADLVGRFVGSTAIKTRAKIQEAMGGILFIDEAYSLARGGENSFGGEAVDELLKFMTDDRDKLAVIAAGYPDAMNRFLRINAGLARRFGRTIDMPEYTDEQLAEILIAQARRGGNRVDEDARPIIRQKLAAHRTNCARAGLAFGFAGDAGNLLQAALEIQALRLDNGSIRSISEEEFSPLTADDFRQAALGSSPAGGSDA